ncbi:MAG: hypothetical protein LBE02_06365 [Spirochaetaceae bacterium]|jgi:hypothetical protein|nr:hypothetical protein [Spirochaetaceae bacterium]
MTGRYPVLFLAVSLLLFSGCAAGGPSELPPSGDLYFVPQILPNLTVPSDAGARSEDPTEESGELRRAFQEAYVEALIRGLPLRGVLGSDRVNPWPERTPEGWTQNWASSDTEMNSWGIPGLVLALRDYNGPAGSPVYSVFGRVLHQYGISAGINRANGAAGYGIPLEELGFSQGAAVQRFSRGIIQIDREGSRFIPQAASVPFEYLSSEQGRGEFTGRDIPPEVSTAFAFAFISNSLLPGRDWTSDGPVVKAAFPVPWVLKTQGEDLSLTGIYVKSYNRGKDILVVVEGPLLPVRAHRLSDPVLSVLTARLRLPGLERENVLGRAGGGTALVQSLAGGFAIYGPPLSDVLPWPLDEEDLEGKNSEGAPLFKEAQRFGRGWIIVKPPLRPGEEDGYGESAEVPAAGSPAAEVPAEVPAAGRPAADSAENSSL